MKELTKKVWEVTSLLTKTKNPTFPFEVLLEKGIDATKQKPYYTKIKILYHDMTFKKRISNLLKDKKLLLEYQFQEVNKGTFLKPNKVWEVNTRIKEAMLSTGEAFLVELLVPIPVSTHLSDEQVLPLKRINGQVFYFSNEASRNQFQDSLFETLNGFLQKEYEKYQVLTQERNER